MTVMSDVRLAQVAGVAGVAGNGPIVSVVMVVCNVERFLVEAIESILGQTFREFEFIIVDFGSTDQSKGIVSSYAAKDQRIKLHEIPHCGLAEARNASCALAKGQYIAIQDADDVSVPCRLMSEVDFMEKHPAVGLLGGAVEWIDAAGKRLLVTGYPTEDREIRTAFTSYCPFWQPTVLIRKEVFVGLGGYRLAFAPSEDYDLWLRISEQYQCANLSQVMLRYRIHSGQLSLRKRKQQVLCFLGAQASAASRKAGTGDPLNTVGEITPGILAELGVTEAMQQMALAEGYQYWIQHMYMAGEHKAALSAAHEMLSSCDWKYAQQRPIADVYVIAARIHWRNKKFVQSFFAAAHALATRPKTAGRPFKPLLRRLGLL